MFKKHFEFIEYFVNKKLLEEGKKQTQSNAAEYLNISIGKYQAWSNGQWPSMEDMKLLVQNHNFSPSWLLLGIEPAIQMPLNKPFNKDLVNICDTLNDLTRDINDPINKIAEIGNMSTQDLYDCMNSQKLPSVNSIAKWILHYKINANFLLAQIGQPFLTEKQFTEKGKLDWVRKTRGDFDFLNLYEDENQETENFDNQKNKNEDLFKEYKLLFDKYEKTLIENANLKEKLAAITGKTQEGLSKSA